MNISGYNTFDIANGTGIRVSLFVSGCQFHCPGCFNPETFDFNYGIKYTQELENKLLEKIKQPEISGLSLLGGDPLWQNEEGLKILISLCKKVHDLNKDIWMWTGFVYEDILNSENNLRKELVSNIDYLIDGPFIQEQKDLSLPWRGSRNQRIIKIGK